ncbi:hypothetical protein SCUCBS95973_008908 [Sporothrix curviconia]|uniref:Uncharacterized protein n=1 Tax=Sporothrix curviconia TaxID=1260050 RepID=A0ABP0CQL4_9PEZI
MLVTLYGGAPSSNHMWPGYAALALNGGISFREVIGAVVTKKRIHNIIQATLFIGSALLAATASCTPDTPTRAIVLIMMPLALVDAGLPSSSVGDFITALTGGNTTALDLVPGVSPSIIAAGSSAYQLASAASYRTVFYSTIAFSGVGIIFSIFLPNIDHLLTSEVSTTLHSGKADEAVAPRAQAEK